jgi:UDP-GlcNAc3NAcA epimerase
LNSYGIAGSAYVLATIHRQENTDSPERLGAIFEALQKVSRVMPVILPLHPRTRQCLADGGEGLTTDGLIVLPPIGYLDMVMLERSASVIATDSGGIQKEAYFHQVPCVTLRGETEWVELIEMGWNRLAPPGQVDIAESILQAVDSKGMMDAMPLGNGDAVGKIVALLQGKH